MLETEIIFSAKSDYFTREMTHSLSYGIKNDPIWDDKYGEISVNQEALRNKLLIHDLSHRKVMNNSGPLWAAEWWIAMTKQAAWLVDEREQKKLKCLEVTVGFSRRTGADITQEHQDSGEPRSSACWFS